MTEPLLRRLAARGEAARPWPRCPGWRRCTAPCRRWREVIELPFAHGRLDWAARRRIARHAARPLRRRLRAAQLDQVGADPLVRPHPACAWATTAKAAGCCSTGELPNPGGRPPMVAFYRALAGEPAAARCAPAPAASSRAVLQTAANAGRRRAGRLLGFRARRRIRPGQVLAGRALRRAGAQPARRDGLPVLLLGSGKEAALVRADRRTPRPAPAACWPARPR